jgi:hypothetical protein
MGDLDQSRRPALLVRRWLASLLLRCWTLVPMVRWPPAPGHGADLDRCRRGYTHEQYGGVGGKAT